MSFRNTPDVKIRPKKRMHASDMNALAKATKMAQKAGEVNSSQTPPSSSQPLPSGSRAPPRPLTRVPSRPTVTPNTFSDSPTFDIFSIPSSEADNKDGFDEFTIVSGGISEQKYSIMTFKPPNSKTIIQFPDQFQQPIKLNRKQPKSMLYAAPPNVDRDVFVPLKPMLGQDGKPVYGPDGKIIMVNSEGQTLATFVKMAARQNKGKGKAGGEAGNGPGAKKKANNRPKTKQTFKASEETRLKRKEEYHPWVMEDAGGNQEWIGRMDAKNDEGIWGLFRIDPASGNFLFHHVHRFYNFVDKRQYVASQRADDVNEAFNKKKTVNIVTEFTRRGGGSQATAASALRAETSRQNSVKREQNDDLFGDEGDRKADMGAEGDLDEMEWEDDVADDDEGHQHEEMASDDEEKQTKERLKKEYKAANKTRDGQIDDDDDDDDLFDLLSGEGKKMKSTLSKTNQEYDDESDDEDDPYGKAYGGKKEEEDPDSQVTLTGVRQQSKPVVPVPDANLPKPKAQAPAILPAPLATGPIIPPPRASSVNPNSRASSPGFGAGQALVAKRATSPNRPNNRASSPLAHNTGSRASSPSNRITSPAAPNGAYVSMSGVVNNSTPVKLDKKRKSPSEDVSPPPRAGSVAASAASPPGGGDNKPKKKLHKTDVPEPTTEVLISFLKTMPNYTATSGQVSDRFGGKKWKAKLLELLKPIIDLGHGENGIRTVTLKPQLR